jgi:O-acetyl-ADP-ribose deacetylase (regulator of RNase III)
MKFISGNIFESDAEALVNSVNTVGVMGKGIALQFKERFPANYKLYVTACKNEEVKIGKMFITPTNSLMNPKWIINFPTKKHWMHNSSYEFIEAGLDDLVTQIEKLNIQSIAIPPLGAGQGGLNWEKVKELIQLKLGHLNIEITVFETVNLVNSNVINAITNLTKPRAMVLALIAQYKKLGYDISLLEIQKLAYFLQRMGQKDLKLNFKQYHYGPYAHNLQHLLHELEKGFISSEKSILDSKPLDLIYLNNDKLEAINQFVNTECSSEEKERLGKVFELMSGYESPFGLELLATVDWIKSSNKKSNLSEMEIKEKIKLWSKRKGDNFKIEHIQAALNRLSRFEADLFHN